MYQISTLHYVKKHWLGSSVLRIWSHLLKKSLMENFIFYAVQRNIIPPKYCLAAQKIPGLTLVLLQSI